MKKVKIGKKIFWFNRNWGGAEISFVGNFIGFFGGVFCSVLEQEKNQKCGFAHEMLICQTQNVLQKHAGFGERSPSSVGTLPAFLPACLAACWGPRATSPCQSPCRWPGTGDPKSALPGYNRHKYHKGPSLTGRIHRFQGQKASFWSSRLTSCITLAIELPQSNSRLT